MCLCLLRLTVVFPHVCLRLLITEWLPVPAYTFLTWAAFEILVWARARVTNSVKFWHCAILFRVQTRPRAVDFYG
jgi:hypothetical protein